jgi:transcriptional regulator
MYQPPHFREQRVDVLNALITAHPFATLVTVDPQGLDANHIPFVLHPDEGPHGTLRGHVSRANPVWKNIDPATDALAIFQGPDAYITPSWYPSKKVDGKVVPTWTYATVHAHGPLQVIDDKAALRQHLDCLVASQEQDRPVPWYASDAPADYIANHMKGIVGIEMPIARLEGKWKVNQSKPEQDRIGAARGLRLEGGEKAQAIADVIDNKGG